MERKGGSPVNIQPQPYPNAIGAAPMTGDSPMPACQQMPPGQGGYAMGAGAMSYDPQQYAPMGTQEVDQPYVIQLPPPTPPPWRALTWVIVLGIVFCILRLITAVLVIIVISLDVSNLKPGNPDRRELISDYPLAAFVFLFELTVIIGYSLHSRGMVIYSLVMFVIGVFFFGFSAGTYGFAASVYDPKLETGKVDDVTRELFGHQDIRSPPGTPSISKEGDKTQMAEIQKTWECCGIFGPEDYWKTQGEEHERLLNKKDNDPTIPLLRRGKDRKVFKIGCQKKIFQFLHERSLRNAITTGVLCGLSVAIRNKEYNGIPPSCRGQDGKLFEIGCQKKILQFLHPVMFREAISSGAFSGLYLAGIVVNFIALIAKSS